MSKREDKKAAAKEFKNAKREIEKAQERGVLSESKEGLEVQEKAWKAREKAPWWAKGW